MSPTYNTYELFCRFTMAYLESPLYIACVIFSNIAAFFELLLVIFFTYQQLYKRNSTAYTSVYYVLLNVGYAVAVFYTFAWLFYDLFSSYSMIFQYIAFPSDWYFLFFLAFWNFVVGLYRCTALAFPLKHERVNLSNPFVLGNNKTWVFLGIKLKIWRW